MKILLVEDDKIQARQMKRLIENHFKEPRVTVAHTLDQAKEALDRDSFEVLLVDLVLDEDRGHLRLPDIGEYDGSQVLGHARNGRNRALGFLLAASSMVDKEFLLEFTDRYRPLDIIVKNMIYGSMSYQDIVIFKLKVAENLLKERG